MTTQYTAGPWHIGVRQPNSDKFVYGPAGEEIADCDRLTNFPDNNLANARLIAAAPDLLHTLQSIVDAKAVEYDFDYEFLIDNIKLAASKAIAKALN